MDRQTWLHYFESAPEQVQDYLLDHQASRHEEEAQTKLAYDNDAWDRVMDVAWDAIFGQISKQDFRERLKRLAGDRKPEEVERTILASIVLPLADLVSWDVETRLQELGVPLSQIQGVPRITLRPVSYGAAARRIAYQSKLSVLTEEMARRLRDVIMSYVKGVRRVEQVKEILERRQEEGGLGFTAEQAETFISSMIAFLNVTKVLSEEDYAVWLTQFEHESEARQMAAMAPKILATHDQDTLAGTPVPSTYAASVLEQIVQQIVSQIQHPDLDEYLSKRLQNMVSTRLREVRNAAQTKAMLTRDPRVGGLGFETSEAERIAFIIEQAYQAHRAEIEAEERQKIQAVTLEQQSKLEERKKRESEEHAQWFKEKIQGTTLAEVMQMPRSTSPTPASPRGASPRPPAVDGVRPPSALTGLAEELGSMTVASFRRLAKAPDQAAEKIRQKFETLRAESFEGWTSGIEAWRSSPLEQAYLTLVAQSFSVQKPVAELAETRHAQDSEALTAEEVGALVTLNAQIHF